MNEQITPKSVQTEYQEGKKFKTNLSLYDTCKQNENFYLGKHWEGLKTRSIQPQTYNFLRRIISTAQALVVSDDIGFEIRPYLSTLGKHWEGLKTRSIQPQTYNFLRRIISTAQALVVSDDIGFEIRPYLSTEERDEQGAIMEECVRAVIERQNIKSLNRESLHDCAVFGDSAMFFWFDPDLESGQQVRGDIRAEVLMNTNIIFGNPFTNKVQEQPYIILARRRPVSVVRAEAKRNGVTDWDKIKAEHESDYMGEDRDDGGQLVTELTRFWKEREGEDGAPRVRFMRVCGEVVTHEAETTGKDRDDGGQLVTELTRFWKEREGEDGAPRVRFMRVCGEVVTHEAETTGMSLYPLAYWSWIDRKNCMHGISPMTECIPTQIAINQLMTYIQTFHRNFAFPKFVYDIRKFPNGWDGDPGKAIAINGDVTQGFANVMGGVNLPPMVTNPKFVYDIRKFPNGWDGDPGKAIAINGDVTQGFANVMGGVNLPPMVTNIVEMMRSMMQDCLGASDASLGNVKPDNTSAIIAAQKATSAPLELQKRKFEQFNEDCIRIIVDMMCACYGVRYVVTDEAQADPMTGEQIKRKTLSQLDFDALEIGQLDINVEVGAASYWSELVQTTTLDNLFNKQVISDPELFLETIPAAQVPNKNELIRSAAEQKKMAQQMAMAAPQNG